MLVVGHQRKTVHADAEALGKLAQNTKKQGARLVVEKDRVTAVPAVHDTAAGAGEVKPGESHGRGDAAKDGKGKEDVPDPVHTVRPGDLLCAPRGEEFTKLVADFGSLRRGTYHCEVVVSATGGVVASIGGNVLDAVALTRGPLDAQGRALPTPRRPWRVVLVLEP